ncbi:hypothetical protein EJB05_16307, partial [Eragrostis curvula]
LIPYFTITHVCTSICRRNGASGSSPTRPPPAKLQNKPSTTTIHSLGEDLLLAIFLQLPSLATLVRAALTCRPWRHAVASSPAFRRRFRALHPPPFLGLFFQVPGVEQTPNTPAFPTFIPARRRGRDLAAAIRGGDFFLTSLDDFPDETPCWYIADFRGGRVLLMNWYDSSLVVFNPLTRRSEDAFDLGPQDLDEGCRGHFGELDARLLFSDEDPTSFRVVLLGYDDSRVRANVFSSETGKWSVLPWVDVPASSDTDGSWLQNDGGLQANGFLYWVYEDRRYLISLDTSTMEFSVAELPHCLRLKQCSFDIGETKDGATCIVYSDQLNVGILILTRDDDGVQRWVPDRIVRLDTELERVLQDGLEDDSGLLHLVDTQSDLIVFAVQEGYAYFVLVTSVMDDAEEPRWFLSLCLDTMKLERLFRRTLDSDVYPYIMAWPPSLVGNYGQFALKDAPSNA